MLGARSIISLIDAVVAGATATDRTTANRVIKRIADVEEAPEDSTRGVAARGGYFVKSSMVRRGIPRGSVVGRKSRSWPTS